MTDREDLVPQCISVCKVPKDIPYEILLTKLQKHFVKGTVKANTDVQGLEDDSNLCRVILLLNDKAVVKKLLQVNEEGIEHNGRHHTLFYSETVECEIPEEWQELPEEEEEDEDEAKPLPPMPQTRQASGRQYYDDHSGPVSGFYENYDPPNMNPTGDQGQDVDTAGDNQRQGRPSQHQGQPSNIQGHHGNFQGQQGNFHGHPGNFPIPPGQMYPPQFQYPGQPHSMEGQAQSQESGSNQGEGQTARPGQMQHMPEGYYGPPFGYPFPYPPHPTQAGADGDPHVQGQGHPNMQGQMPYGMPPQYYFDKQGRPTNFPIGMPMSMQGGYQVNPNMNLPNQGAQQQPTQIKGQGHTPDDEGQGFQTPPPPYTSGDHSQTGYPQPSQAILDQEIYMQKFQGKIQTETAYQEYEIKAQNETPRKDYMDGDTDVSLEEPRPTKIIVTGLPSGAHDDYLQMFFEKKAGCEPLSMEIDEDETEAIIEFESPDAVDKVLQHRPIKMLGAEVDVEIYIPELDVPLWTIVVEGPESLMNAEMLELYFENKRKCGGDTIVDIQIDENHAAYITYESEEVAQRVVDKGKHKIANKELCVRLHVPDKKKRTKRQISKASTDRDSEPENIEPIRTIEVRGPASVLNEELMELYFENKKAGGGPTEKIEVLEDVAYITFETEEVAERVANKQGHKINKLPVTVELFNPQEEEHEPPRTIKVAGMKHVKSHETVEMYFENKRRAHGGPIDGSLLVDDEDDNIAYITFESHEVANAVANRSHSVDNCNLEVSLHVPGKTKKGKQISKGSEEEISEPPKTVKVKGITQIKSTSTLEYYFENKRRSGGGNHTMEICEEDEDIAYFTFETHEVAISVSQRSHSIEGVTLTVSLYNKPKPPPQYDDRVLIKGVKSTTTKDCLFNFLEAKSGCTPQSLVHGEKEGDILVLFESVPDFDKLDNISKTMKLEGASLKMSRVAESNCVLVPDLPSNTTRDTIQFYFENHRRSGGGPVLKVEVNKEDDSMIVFFEDYKVAEAVSQRSHKIGDATIKVNLYLSCIGRPQGDGSEARFKVPVPMVITGVEWQKIKFLLNSTVNKVALDTQLESCHSKIIWPEKGSKLEELTLECMLTPDMKDCRKLAKGWSNCAEKDFQDFIRNIIMKILSVITDVWDKVMAGMANISITNPEAVAVFVDREQGNITIVGLKHAAESVIHNVGKIIKDVEEEAENEKKKVKEIITNIELIKTKMLLAAKFPTKMEEKYTGVKVKINQTKNEIIFEGLLADVRGVKVDMYEMFNEFAHDKVRVSPMKAELYQNKNVKDYIVRKLKNRKVTAVWEVEDSWLVIYTNIPNHILICKGIIEGAIEENMISLSKASRPIMSSELWQTKLDEIKHQYADRVAIDVTSDMNNVHICAIDEIVKDLLDMVNKFLRLNTVIEDGFPLSKSITKLLEQHHKSELEDISKVLQSSHVMISYGKGIDGFKVQGTEDGLKKAKDKLKGLIDRVKSRDKEVRRPGLRVHMRSEEGKTSLSNIESSLKCVVTVKGGSDTEDFYETTGDGLYDTIPGDATDDNWQTSAVRRHAECKAYDNRKIYTVEGDMTELTVDVLVNTADDKLGLTGGLAKVIVNKGGSVISNACKDYIRKEGKLEESHAFVSPGGNLKAKHIVHIVGPVWKQGNENEEERLTEAVFRAMKKADIEGALSIAIPAISCGVYSFPVKKATTIIADAVKNFFREEQDTPIREVYLCDVKGNTVQMFTEALKVAFGQSNVREFPKTKPQPNQNRPLPQPPGRNRGNESDSDDDTPYTTQGRKKPPPGAKQVMFGGPPVPSPRTKTSGGGANVTIGNISVSIVKGEIAKQKIDMIVNTTAKNLDLKNGAVSASLSKDAGPGLQQEVTKNYPNGIKDGEVAMTTGHSLKCKHIVHGSLMNWDGGSAATGALHDLMATCLKMATKESVKSVAFPAIGTGNLGFPRDIVAKEMFQAVSNFHAKSPQSTVVDIKFIVYQKDEQTIKAFETEERLWTTGKRATMASRGTRRAEPSYQNVRAQSSDDETDFSVFGGDGKTHFNSGNSPPNRKLKHSNTEPNLRGCKKVWDICDPEFLIEDDQIDKICRIIKRYYPDINGLAEVCVVSFGKGEKIDNPFIQILNEVGQHWITVTTIDCTPGVVKVYDSLCRHVPKTVLRCILHLMKFNRAKSVKIIMPTFQYQNNKLDCGLFAIASAISLASGNDPSIDKYDKFQMRQFLKQCLEQRVVDEFPKYDGHVKRLQEKIFTIYMCCECQDVVVEETMGVMTCEGCRLPCHLPREHRQSCSVKTEDVLLCQKCSVKIH